MTHNKNRISVYLIEKDLTEKDIIKDDENIKRHEVNGVGVVFYKKSYQNKPRWLSEFLLNEINNDELKTSNARSVLLVTVSHNYIERTFAVVMGYGKSLLNDDVVEERFGLKVTLNSIDTDSLRRISKINIGGNLKISNEQLPKKSGVDDFGVDVNRDLVASVAGKGTDSNFSEGIISGSDALSITAEVDIRNIKEFLEKVFEKYSTDDYKNKFPWIDQIKEVKNKELKDELNKKVIESLNRDNSAFWFAPPDIIQWENYQGFWISNMDMFDDFIVKDIVESFRNPLEEYDQLKNKYVYLINNETNEKQKIFRLSDCVFGEVKYNNEVYTINKNKWYQISKDLVEQVEEDYDSTNVSKEEFIEYGESTSENDYNQKLTNSRNDELICMDAKVIYYGGGHSSIEVCDVLSKNGELIHVKRYNGSATLSHLFNQGLVSGELIREDRSFLELANSKIAEISNDNEFKLTSTKSNKIIFGIVTNDLNDLPRIPFFSKVTLKHVKKRLAALNYSVELKNIRGQK